VLLRKLTLGGGTLAFSLACGFGFFGTALQSAAFKYRWASRALWLHAA